MRSRLRSHGLLYATAAAVSLAWIWLPSDKGPEQEWSGYEVPTEAAVERLADELFDMAVEGFDGAGCIWVIGSGRDAEDVRRGARLSIDWVADRRLTIDRQAIVTVRRPGVATGNWRDIEGEGFMCLVPSD